MVRREPSLVTPEISTESTLFLGHLATLSEQLSPELLAAVKQHQLMLNGGDFILKKLPAADLFYQNINHRDFTGPDVIFLSTPSARFAYDPATGREIANNMNRYGITDRTTLPARWRTMLINDSYDLRERKGLSGLAGWQDIFVKRLTDLLTQESPK